MVLAAILLKMGGYGFLRFSLPMFPVGSDVMGPLVLWMSAIAIVYTSLVALAQNDMKKLIAYSSVAHMGYVTMGIFAANQQGVDGAIFQMHQPRLHLGRAVPVRRRDLRPDAHPRDRRLWRAGEPDAGLCADLHVLHHGQRRPARHQSGFVGEFLTLVGIFQVNTWVAAVADLGRDPVGGLCAVAVPPGGVRRSDQGSA